jgi:DNA-binding CsgD family transcriptional regulator
MDHHRYRRTIDLENLNAAQRYLKRVDDQISSLTYLGLGLWLSWIMTFMSGSVWIAELETNAWSVSDVFMLTMSGLATTLLVFAFFSDKIKALLFYNRVILTAALLACICTLLVMLSTNGVIDRVLFFYVPGYLAGLSMGVLFLRCAPLYGALQPKRAVIYYAASSLFACAYYFFLVGVPRLLAEVCFVLTPLLAALFLLIRFYSRFGEAEALWNPSKTSGEFRRFLSAVFIYAVAARFMQATYLTALPVTETSLCSTYMIIALIVFSTLLIVLMLTVPKTMDFGRLYYVIILVLIASLVFTPFLNLDIVSISALGSFSAHSFTILFWCMLAYIVFQAKCDPVKIFGFGGGVFYVGSMAGNLLGVGMIEADFDVSVYYGICAAIAFACVVAATVVFPESKIKTMLAPIDDELLEPHIQEKRFHAGHWISAAREIAQERQLTERETEVFLLLARGKTTEQVSERLTVSFYTTRAHVRNIYAKLGVHSRAEMTDLIERHAGE